MGALAHRAPTVSLHMCGVAYGIKNKAIILLKPYSVKNYFEVNTVFTAYYVGIAV